MDDEVLSWVADGDDDSRSVLLPAPAVNTGFREQSTYRICGASPEHALLVDDESLPRDEHAAWIWRPAFFAGEVQAELRDSAGRRLAQFRLDVAPDPRKSGREHFEQMLGEIERVHPTLILGAEPPTKAIGALGTEQDPWLAFGRLRRHAPEFLAALRAVSRRPRKRLESLRETVTPQQVRRVDRQTVMSAMRSPSAVGLIAGVPSCTVEQELVRMDVPRVEETLDSAANRCLLALALGLSRRVQDLRVQLHDRVAREKLDPTRTALSTRWPTRRRVLDELASGIRRALRSRFFAQVRRAEVSASGLNAIAAAPLYARAWRAGWSALRSGIGGVSPDERTWISPTWEVFERWCFVRLLDLLQRDAPGMEFRPAVPCNGHSSAGWTGEDGDRRVEILLQPVFPAGRPGSGRGFWSVSQQRVPDIVILMQRGDRRRFVVFDAKYRVSRASVLDGMTSAHVYQDSLRLDDLRPSMSLLLVPGPAEPDWLQEVEFQRQNRVGVHVLSVADAHNIPPLLLDELKDVGLVNAPS